MRSAALQDESSNVSLAGKCVAVTGRLASLERSEAARLIESAGGEYAPRVTGRCDLLVVGQQGWPLRKDGRLTRNLSRARALRRAGAEIEILREDEFLERLGLSELGSGIRRRYTLEELCRLCQLPAGRVRSWIRSGLLEPAEVVRSVPCFTFQQVTAVRTLDEIVRAGVTVPRLRRSLEQLRAWMPEAEDALARIDLLEGRGRVVVRSADGRLMESSGQQLFEFGEGAREPALRLERSPRSSTPIGADELFERALELEETGKHGAAADAYGEWLMQFGPDAVVCFNLANALYASGRREAAIERYRQAVEIDPDYVEAWSNMGSVLAEIGRKDEAVSAFQQALRTDPAYGNALYNLADTLDELGRQDEARGYWQAYLRQDVGSPWSEYARARLAR